MRFAILTIMACLWLAAPAQAQTESGFEIGLEIFNYQYTEPNNLIPNQTLDEQQGPSMGILADYTWRSDAFFVTLDGRVSLTKAKYTAANFPTVNNIQNPVYEFRAVIGHDFLIAANIAASPFAGIGHRNLHDDIDGGRTQRYLYVPVGLNFAIADGDWIFRPSFEYDFLLSGENKTEVSKIGYSNDVTFKQDSGFGLRAKILAETSTDWGRVAFGPFVRYWHADKSDVAITTSTTCGSLSFGCVFGTGTIGLIEPRNHTLEIGLEAKIGL